MTAYRLAALAFAASVLPVAAQDARVLRSEEGAVRVETFARGLENPWGFAFLPDGRLIVTERPGRLRLFGRDGAAMGMVAGLPALSVRSQGGLLDVAVAPDFAQSGTVFLCHAAAGDPHSSTALSRGRLVESGGTARLEDVRMIFRQRPQTSRGQHYGCRIVFGTDGNLFLTLGDHFTQRDEAQNLGNTIGKIVRLRPDGSIPPDNPFVNREGVDPAIYSYGHRNVQGATLGPDGALWVSEHGARGGDEINRVLAGRNYGWPVITYARDYSGAVISRETARPGMEQPVHHWTTDDTIAPSGAAFVSGTTFPRWRGNLLVGGLRSQLLMRLVVENGRVTHEERLLRELRERIRAVQQGPDGAIYLLTDDRRGQVLRLTPAP
jgi:glucose/arabinose dehydrogenase